jgi:hypothetical protein
MKQKGIKQLKKEEKEIDPVLGLPIHREHITSEKQLIAAIGNEETAYHV